MSAKRIVILRHGEKTSDPTDESLSVQGYERAAALAVLLATDYPDIVAIYAAGVGPGSPSLRPGQTVAPLVARLNIQPVENYLKDNWSGAVQAIQNTDYTNGTVILCWVHDEIPDIAKLLGAGKHPWPSGRYDVLWILDYSSGSCVWSQQGQLLMYGDTALASTVEQPSQ
jgi:hypothetical protein